nr:DUF3108 domain-containing protein [Rhizobium halophytocola]
MGAAPAMAQDATQSRTEYQITLAGIPIAQASFITLMDKDHYSIAGEFKSGAIVNLITEISAKTSTSGKVSDARLEPRSYSLVYRKGKQTETYKVLLAGGNVTESHITPAPKRRPKTWVPVTPADLQAVLDPLTSLMVPSSGDVCSRTLPVFDGESRLDLVMSPKGKRVYDQGKVSTEAVVCGVRYVPKAGFKQGRDDIEALKRSTGMEIWFAKAGDLPLYAPVRAVIPTRYGAVDISAIRFDG